MRYIVLRGRCYEWPHQKSLCADDGDWVLYFAVPAGRGPWLQHRAKGIGANARGPSNQSRHDVWKPVKNGKGWFDPICAGRKQAEDLLHHGAWNAGTGTGNEAD